MKRRELEHGLFVRVIESPESAADFIEVLKGQAGALESYLADAERQARDVLVGAGIDPDTLWQHVEIPNGSAIRMHLVRRQEHAPEVDDALRILEEARLIGPLLDDRAARSGLLHGIRLAQACAQLNANQAWSKPVLADRKRRKAASSHGLNRRQQSAGDAASLWQPWCDALHAKNPTLSWSRIAAQVGQKFGVSYKKIQRYCDDPAKK